MSWSITRVAPTKNEALEAFKEAEKNDMYCPKDNRLSNAASALLVVFDVPTQHHVLITSNGHIDLKGGPNACNVGVSSYKPS